MPESGFSLDKIMHLYINFHRLALTRGSSYIKLPEWIKNKKTAINPQNKDEECFKWAVIAALRSYENQHNLKGLEFPASIKKINKFEKKATLA